MKRILMTTLMVFSLAVNGWAATTIEIEYPYGYLFDDVHKDLIDQFEKAHPGIGVKIRKVYKDYEDGTQSVLRAAITGDLPDITFQGLNRFRIFVDRGIAVPLDSFIESEQGLDTQGFDQSLYAPGKFNGKRYGMPFAISLPVAFYNMELVKAAGWPEDKLPQTWDEMFDLSRKIDELGDDIHGMYYFWAETGNWQWQALVNSQGGTLLTPDEKKVAFTGPEGRWAMRKLYEMRTRGKQPNIAWIDAKNSFTAGKLGITVVSVSVLQYFLETVGDKFEVKVGMFPEVKPGGGNLPPGGNGLLVVTKDRGKLEACWQFVKFWLGPAGAEAVAKKTGYMPPNRVAAETNLKAFYDEHPNRRSVLSMLSYLSQWYAYPGENGLKITDVITNHIESIMSGKSDNPDHVLKTMGAEVAVLLP